MEDYNKQIEQLKQEMNDATHGADNIRSDISALAQRYTVIDRDEECGVLVSLLYFLEPYNTIYFIVVPRQVRLDQCFCSLELLTVTNYTRLEWLIYCNVYCVEHKTTFD